MDESELAAPLLLVFLYSILGLMALMLAITVHVKIGDDDDAGFQSFSICARRLCRFVFRGDEHRECSVRDGFHCSSSRYDALPSSEVDNYYDSSCTATSKNSSTWQFRLVAEARKQGIESKSCCRPTLPGELNARPIPTTASKKKGFDILVSRSQLALSNASELSSSARIDSARSPCCTFHDRKSRTPAPRTSAA